MPKFNPEHINDINKESTVWCITINNPTDKDIASMSVLDPNELYKIWQVEKGKKNVEHIQGYIELNRKRKRAGLKKVYPRAHLTIRRTTQAACIAYCQKDKTRIKPKVELGTAGIPTPGKRTDKETLYKNIQTMTKIDLIRSYPGEYAKAHKSIDILYLDKYQNTTPVKPIVTVLYGLPRTGKTRYVYDNHERKTIYTLNVPSKTDQIPWFDGYEPGQHTVLLIDDFYGSIQYEYLLKLLDRYGPKAQFKGGMTTLLCTHIYITSNQHPDYWYQYDDDRIHKQALFGRFDEIREIEMPTIKEQLTLKPFKGIVKESKRSSHGKPSGKLDKGVLNLQPYKDDTRKESKYHLDFDMDD